MKRAVVGFVLAGGASRRMGHDKAGLPWGGTTLLGHALARLSAVCGEVRVLAGEHERYTDCGRPVLLDAWPAAGPLAGVLAGLESLDSDQAGLFLAVDLPHVPIALLASLAERAAGWDAAVPVSATGPEPLCAVYQAACRVPIRRRLAAGERRMDCFWPDVRVRRIEDAELHRFGDPSRLFANLNTLEAYQAGLPRCRSESGTASGVPE